MVYVGDNGKITDEGEFSHKAPLAGPPRPFKHGGKAVGGWGDEVHFGSMFRKRTILPERRRSQRASSAAVLQDGQGGTGLDPTFLPIYTASNIQPIGNGLVVAQLG
jgi:hypothetical protein